MPRLAFQGSRAQFLVDAKPEYTSGVQNGYAKDAVAVIQRCYFKIYPIELPHDQEPSEEHMKNIDYDAPDYEPECPNPELLDDEEYERQLVAYEERQRLIIYRKGRIQRRLAYLYGRDYDMDPKDTGAQSPHRILLHKLTGTGLKKPRQKTASNIWRRSHRDEIEQEAITRAGNVKGKALRKKLASLREKVSSQMFAQLSAEEKNEWEELAKEEHAAALKQYHDVVTNPPSEAPEDRQKVIQDLAQFIQPILDMICEATGWKVTLIAGGPEPADKGLLNIVSFHSGTTRGAVKMNFGRSEQAAYQKYLIPMFHSFLRKCYTVEECRARALPLTEGFEPLEALMENNPDAATIHRGGYPAETTTLPQLPGSSTPQPPPHPSPSRSQTPGSLPSGTPPQSPSPLSVHSRSPTPPSPSPHSLSGFSHHPHSPPPLSSQASHPILLQSSVPVLQTNSQIDTSVNKEQAGSSTLNQSSTSQEHAQCSTSIQLPSTSNDSHQHPVASNTSPAQSTKESSHGRRKRRLGEQVDESRGMEIGPTPSKKQKRTTRGGVKPARFASNVPPPSDSITLVPPKSLSLLSLSPSTNSVPVPIWFTQSYCYFSEGSSVLQFVPATVFGTEWQGLLSEWAAFEKQANYTDTGRLPAKHRPSVVADWIKNARSDKWCPTQSVNLSQYRSSFRQWWLFMQPGWRMDNGSIVEQKVEGDWGILKTSGVNGLLSVVAALFFWGLHAHNSADECVHWKSAVQSCRIVLRHL